MLAPYTSLSSSPTAKGSTENSQRPGEVRLFVGNLSYDLKLDALTAEFGSCGTITRSRLLNGADGRSRGVAFLTFSDKAAADRVIAKYHDR